jgi:hypothetical protein
MSANTQSMLEREGLIEIDRPFELTAEDSGCLALGGIGRAKNISLSPDGEAVRGVDPASFDKAGVLMRRYAAWAEALVLKLAPGYAGALERGRTSLRTRAVSGEGLSPRKDDRRLHVDAFASQPTGGQRILRVFSNINPAGEARLWRIGEPFEDYARNWIGRLRRPMPGEAWTLHRLGITKGRRTPYDALMLGLHDASKLDADYQRDAPRRDVAFPAGSSWIVFTDSTVHAAIAGRHALEQTFYLPVEAMAEPAVSPLRTLERIAHRRLV